MGPRVDVLEGRERDNTDAVHGRGHRLECADPRRRADVPVAKELGKNDGVGGVSRGASRIQDTDALEGSDGAVPGMVCALCEGRWDAREAAGEASGEGEEGRRVKEYAKQRETKH